MVILVSLLEELFNTAFFNWNVRERESLSRRFSKNGHSSIITFEVVETEDGMLNELLEVDFVLETVNKLIKTHGNELTKETLIHSHQGCHYTSSSFIQLVNDKELRQSMSRKGSCWDNAPQESFFGHMKDEIDVSQCIKYREVKAIVNDSLDYYNDECYQWKLAKLCPNQYYEYITKRIYPLKGIVASKGVEHIFSKINL